MGFVCAPTANISNFHSLYDKLYYRIPFISIDQLIWIEDCDVECDETTTINGSINYKNAVKPSEGEFEYYNRPENLTGAHWCWQFQKVSHQPFKNANSYLNKQKKVE